MHIGLISDIHSVGNHVLVHALFGDVDGLAVHVTNFEAGVVQQALVVTLDVELEA